jgi:hypothetical protein
MNRKHVLIGVAALALSAAGVGVAVAGGQSGDAKEQVSGEAALAHHPGTANSVERDSENGATWEVEITGSDGRTVDVRLDESYRVVAVEGDGEDAGEN